MRCDFQMPFKLRLKKSRQYNVVSKNLFVITVELLDHSLIECTLSADSTGQECLYNVCQRVGLHQVFNIYNNEDDIFHHCRICGSYQLPVMCTIVLSVKYAAHNFF